MSIVNKNIFVSAAILLLSVSGCADSVHERRGTQLDVVPVSYSLNLKIKAQQNASAQQELQQFLLEHKKLVLSQPIELIWQTKMGKKWADKTQQQLLNDGVDRKNITLVQGDAGFNGRFDYQIKVTVHKVLLSVCPYFKNGHYSESLDGCYSDSARWQSMVNPQKMLNQSLSAEHANK